MDGHGDSAAVGSAGVVAHAGGSVDRDGVSVSGSTRTGTDEHGLTPTQHGRVVGKKEKSWVKVIIEAITELVRGWRTYKKKGL